MFKFFHRHYHTKYQGIYKNAKKLFIFDLGLFGLAGLMLAVSLFLFFWKPGTTDLVDLHLSLGEARIQSGNHVRLVASYANRTKADLKNVTLTFRLPTAFIVDSSNQTVFNLDNIAPGAKGEKDIYGQLWTSINQEEKIIATLSYTSPEYGKIEQKLATLLVKLPTSILENKITTSEQAYAGSAFPYALTLKNTSDKKLEKIFLTNNWDDSANQNPTWKNIALGPKTEITLNGVLRAPSKEGKIPLQITTKILINEQVIILDDYQKEINLSKPQIYSSAQINSPIAYAEPGQTLPVKISWKNTGAEDYKNVKIRLNFTPGIVDLKTTAKNNNLKVEGTSLVADKQTRTTLANNRAGTEENFEIKIKLLSHFSLVGTDEKINFIITPSAEIPATGIDSGMFSQTGQTALIPLSTDLRFKIETVYYTEDGEQLGRGPLPPRVGETTKYRLVAQIFNASNDVENPTFSAVVPEGVTFTGQQSVSIGASQKYNPTTRTITWSHRSLPAYSQTTLSFEMAITPTDKQIGRIIKLLENIKFSATDSYTGKFFNFTETSLNNKL